MLELHGKYKDGKVWGGASAIGPFSIRPSPKKMIGVKNSLKLPPLSTKPVFGAEKIGRLTISEATIPKFSIKHGRNPTYTP